MGVYIKGMEMPKYCRDCACYYHRVDAEYYDYEVCRASGTIFNYGYSKVTNYIDPFNQRLDTCPLVPVPPHGDLIDRDMLKNKKIAINYDEWDDTFDDGLLFVMEQIDNAATVIPAEEGA